MCHFLKHAECKWDIQKTLLISFIVICGTLAGLESYFSTISHIYQSGVFTVLVSAITVAMATLLIIERNSIIRRNQEKKTLTLRAEIEELNEKLGNLDEIDENNSKIGDIPNTQKREWGKIFDSIHDWVCLIDLESTIIRTNSVGEKFTGRTAKDMVGCKCCTLIHGENEPLDDCPLPKMLKSQQRESVEIQIKDGRWLLITLDPLFDSKGRLVKAIHIARDISSRKTAENEKARLEAISRQLQKADSLGRMAGAIAHHFNNQLMIVIGNLELAISDAPKIQKISENLNAALQATLRASSLSGLMLTYLGKSSDKHEVIDLSEVCRRSLPMLQAGMPSQFPLLAELPPFGPIIRGNVNQVQQALTNLISNAWEACEGQGTIYLGLKTVQPQNIAVFNRHPIDWLPLDNTLYACLEVKDTGTGIIDKDIDKIFDPFFTSKFTGRGLGLPVVLGIARAHHGAVSVESRLGKGSTFNLYFPVLTEADKSLSSVRGILRKETRISQPSVDYSAPTKGAVLLIEDEEPVRKVATSMLLSLGFSVLEATDGIEAISRFQENKDEISWVLCDLTMPHMDGWATLGALRELSPGIPIILSSGYDRSEVMKGDHPEQPNAFLQKPFSLNDLATVVNQTTAPNPNP